MADKKLNEVTKVTDMAYVPVIMADGSIGQIAKSDLASVVAGVIRKNDISTILGVERDDSFNGDVDTLLDANMYIVNRTSTNLPVAAWGTLQVLGDGANVVQIYTQTISGFSVYIRKFYNEWSPWQRIDNFGYNSLEELSAGILSTRKKWLNSGDDLNNVIETGIYRAGGSTVENNPTTATYFMLIVESFDESSILQKFIHNDGRVWFRSRYGSEWREWKQIV